MFGTRLGAFSGCDVVVASGTLLVPALVEDELPVRSRMLVAIGALGGSSVGLPNVPVAYKRAIAASDERWLRQLPPERAIRRARQTPRGCWRDGGRPPDQRCGR